MTKTALLAVLLIVGLLVGFSGALVEQKATLIQEEKVIPVIEETPIVLENGATSIGKVSEVTFSKGEVQVLDKKSGSTITSYTKIDGEKFTGTSRESNDKLIFESSEGKILGLLGTPTVAVSYAYTDTQLKEQITLQSDKAITIPLTLEGGYKLVPLSNGDIRVNNPSTMNWWDGVIIKKPFGTDATGKYIEMSYGIDGTKLSLDYDHSGITYPLVIDPTYVINGITYNYVHPVKFYGYKDSTVVIRYTIHNLAGSNTTTDLWLGGNIKANFSDIRFMNEDASVQLPAYLNVKNESMAEILVSAPLTTTGNVVNTFFNSTSGLSNWTAIPSVKTIATSPYYSQDEWRNYSYDGTNEVAVSVAYQDLFGSDTTFRYANASATTGVNWVAAAPTDAVVTNGNLTLSSDDDMAVSARLKSYKFAGGQIEFSFDHNGDGGGITARDGLWLAMQDLSNSYRITIGDDYAGNENISISNISAGTMTVMNVTDISAIYTSGAKTWVKTKFEETNGSLWVWIRDDTGSYTAAPQIIATNKRSNNWSYGYAGFYSTVGTAGAGNLNTNFDDFTVNAESVVGYTNIPIGGGKFEPMLRGMAPGKYWNETAIVPATRWSDDFNRDTLSEYAVSGSTLPTWDTTSGYILLIDSGANPQLLTKGTKTTNGEYVWRFKRTGATAPQIQFFAGIHSFVFVNNAFKPDGSHSIVGTCTNAENDVIEVRALILSPTNFIIKYTDITSGLVVDMSSVGYGYSMYSEWGGASGINTYQGAGATLQLQQMFFNALSSDSTNGVVYTQSGVSQGARYDWPEYVGLAFTDSTPPNNYNLTLPSISTTTTSDLTTSQLVFTNTAGTGFSNQTGNPLRQLAAAGTLSNLSFDNENLLATPALGNNYIIQMNYTGWEGTQYDIRGRTLFFNPAIYPSGYSMTPITGAVWGNFSTNVSTGSTPIGIAFTDSSEYDPAYPITSWNWSFGDGNYSSIQNPSHLYGNVGTGPVSVTLTVNNTRASDSITRVLTLKTLNSQINPPNFMSVFWPQGIAFTDVSTGTPTAWNWSFGDGTFQTTQNPYHFWMYPGIYTVSLNASTATQWSTNSTQVQVMKWF